MRRPIFFVLVIVLFASFSPAARAQDPFTEKYLHVLEEITAKSQEKVGPSALPRGDSHWGKVVWLDAEIKNASDLTRVLLREAGILEEITPGGYPDIDVQDPKEAVVFMALVQKETDEIAAGRVFLPDPEFHPICIELKNAHVNGYFNPYGLRAGYPVATPRDLAEVKSLFLRHVEAMRSTWGKNLPREQLPWNCPVDAEWPKSYGQELWDLILIDIGFPPAPTDTPRPRRTPTATLTITQTPTGTLTPQPTVTGTRQPTPTPEPTLPPGTGWKFFAGGWTILFVFMALVIIVVSMAAIAHSWGTGLFQDFIAVLIAVLVGWQLLNWMVDLIKFYWR